MLVKKMDLQLCIQEYSYLHVHIIKKSINMPARIASLHISYAYWTVHHCDGCASACYTDTIII